MRRMYSEQELTNVIKEVFDAELASGALDKKVSDAVDAYLVEHPVDVTALEGQDVELNSLDADGLITGGEIVEKMSGYSFSLQETSGVTITPIYAGAVKNGNKLTLVFAGNLTITSDDYGKYIYLGVFGIPSSVGAKLYPSTISDITALDCRQLNLYATDGSFTNPVSGTGYWQKSSNTSTYARLYANGLTNGKTYFVRYEVTFLLSDSLYSE